MIFRFFNPHILRFFIPQPSTLNPQPSYSSILRSCARKLGTFAQFVYIFILELKKVKKYVKKCKNKKYCKGPPFGVFVKNMKYVPHFVAHLVYVPDVPDSWHSCGTKSTSRHFGLKSSFREGRSFLFSVFSRWGKGPN